MNLKVLLGLVVEIQLVLLIKTIYPTEYSTISGKVVNLAQSKVLSFLIRPILSMDWFRDKMDPITFTKWLVIYRRLKSPKMERSQCHLIQLLGILRMGIRFPWVAMLADSFGMIVVCVAHTEATGNDIF